MSSIEVSSQSISQINSDTYLVDFEVKTTVKPNDKIDLTINHSKPISIITSLTTYNNLKNEITNRTNINSEEINIFSYIGNKELSKIFPGKNKIGTVVYPDIVFSLLSQIQLSTNIPLNSKVFIVIDSYPGLLSIEHNDLKIQFIKQDLDNLCKKLIDFQEKTGCEINIIFDKNTFGTIQLVYSIPFNIITSTPDKITKCLCDIVFGKIIGGIQSDFNGIISTNSKYRIIDVFNIPNSEKLNIHNTSIRGSGLTISGNTTSHLMLLIEKNESNDETNKIEFYELHTDTKLFDFNINSEIILNQSASSIRKYIEILKYSQKLSEIMHYQEKYKEHMISNSLIINSIEYDDIESFDFESLSEFKDSIIKKLLHMVQIIKNNWSSIRSTFKFTKINHNNLCDLAFNYNNTYDLPLNYNLPARQVTGFISSF
jgi:hypothetical protein